MFAEVARELQEGDVFFANTIEDADGGGFFVGETNDLAPRATEFPLQRENARGWRMEMLFKECFQGVGGHVFGNSPFEIR